MTALTGGHLQKISRRRHVKLMDQLAEEFNYWFGYYQITNGEAICQILANVCVETAGFTVLKENMNYSEKRLKQVFSFYRKNPALARQHARNPELIANTVYADKNRSAKFKLGNTQEGDGWKFRGNGPPQLTGRHNHQRFADKTGIDVVSNPELLEDPHTGVQATCVFYLSDKRLIANGEAGNTRAFRRGWNGGTHGLSEIENRYLPRARSALKTVKIVPTGEPDEIDPETWEAEDGDVYVDAQSPAPVIRAMQRLLNEKNFKCGAVDGDVGPETRAAMRKFLDHIDRPVEPLRVPLDELERCEPYVNKARDELPYNEAREKVIEKGSRHMDAAGRKKWTGGTIATVATVGAVAEEVGDKVETVQTVTDQVTEAISPFRWVLDLAIEYWWIIIPAIGLWLWIEGDLAERLRVKIWKTGEHS